MKKYIIYISIVAILGFGFYQKIYIPKHTFKITQAQIGDMSLKVNGVGNIDARNIYKIGSVYGGKIYGFNIEEGSYIKKGVKIATIDSVDLSNKIDELKATSQKLSSDISSLTIDKKSAISSYKYQEEIFKKNDKLYKKRAISQLDFQKYMTNRDVAKLKVESLTSKIASLYAQQKQIKANIAGLKQRLKRYTIIAPISGYITRKFVSNYSIIMPNQTLIEIVDPKDVWVATHIDTRISKDVKIGTKATIKLRSSDTAYIGTVVNIKPYNNNITYEREVDVSFDNLPIPFYLQEQALVEIQTQQLNNIVKIPNIAFTLYDEKQGVWLFNNGKVKFKEIKALAYSDKFVATNDLSTSDKIVIPDPKKKPLSNGMMIKPVSIK